MGSAEETIKDFTDLDYKWGFVSDIDADNLPPGLNEEIIRAISAKKEEPEFLLEWRLKAFRHWQKMVEPKWHNVHYDPVDFQKMVYYSAPKQKKQLNSLDEVDPEILETFSKLGIFARKSKSACPMSRLTPF